MNIFFKKYLKTKLRVLRRNYFAAWRGALLDIKNNFYKESLIVIGLFICLQIIFFCLMQFIHASLFYFFPTTLFFLEPNFGLQGGWRKKRKRTPFEFAENNPVTNFLKKFLGPYPFYFSDYLPVELLWSKCLEIFFFDFYTISYFSNTFFVFLLAVFVRFVFLYCENLKKYKWVL